jgi:dCMP deaminase
MPTKQQTDTLYMQVAEGHAKLSKAKRKKVGACLVTANGTILGGVNGTPRGMSNVCEENGITKPEVIHAELNCILKAAREGVSCVGATMYVTLSPCLQCAAMLVQAGVSRVLYREQYRDTKGIDLLWDAGVEVEVS